MERRKLLKSVTSAAAIACAGCLGSAEIGENGENHEIHENVAAAGTVEATFERWIAVEHLRYYDASSDSIAELHPENDWWLTVHVLADNLGGSPVEKDEILDFAVISGGSHTPVRELPIGWESVRARDPEFVEPDSLRAGYYDGEIGPGEYDVYNPLFDVPAGDPFLEWRYPDPSVRLSASSSKPPDQ